ncbi:MAG: SDR family oxidoreductase [Pseudomonadota bacterium]
MNPFENKKALVLGGTSGIGLAIVHRLNNAGCEVIAASRRGSADNLPHDVTVESLDVLDEDSLKQFFSRHAPYDFLVNAATGGARAKGPFLEMEMTGFQGSFAKLWGYTNCVRHGCAHLDERGAIALISGSPARKCAPGMIAISCVGNAVEGFVRGVAPEIAPRRINAVSPGLIDTPMFPQEGDDRQAFFKQATAENVIPRAGTADEIAEGVMFVLSNQFVTGTVVDVDGGILLP